MEYYGVKKLIEKELSYLSYLHLDIDNIATATNNKGCAEKFLCYFRRGILRKQLKNMKKRGGRYSH